MNDNSNGNLNLMNWRSNVSGLWLNDKGLKIKVEREMSTLHLKIINLAVYVMNTISESQGTISKTS